MNNRIEAVVIRKGSNWNKRRKYLFIEYWYLEIFILLYTVISLCVWQQLIEKAIHILILFYPETKMNYLCFHKKVILKFYHTFKYDPNVAHIYNYWMEYQLCLKDHNPFLKKLLIVTSIQTLSSLSFFFFPAPLCFIFRHDV